MNQGYVPRPTAATANGGAEAVARCAQGVRELFLSLVPDAAEERLKEQMRMTLEDQVQEPSHPLPPPPTSLRVNS